MSSGVLKGSEGLVFHTLTADVHSTTAMVEGAACSHRQPSGWIGQMIRSLTLVHSARYAKMKRSPYLYLSCARITLSAELYKYLQTLVGKDEMDVVITLWGMAVPFVVLANLIAGWRRPRRSALRVDRQGDRSLSPRAENSGGQLPPTKS